MSMEWNIERGLMKSQNITHDNNQHTSFWTFFFVELRSCVVLFSLIIFELCWLGARAGRSCTTHTNSHENSKIIFINKIEKNHSQSVNQKMIMRSTEHLTKKKRTLQQSWSSLPKKHSCKRAWMENVKYFSFIFSGFRLPTCSAQVFIGNQQQSPVCARYVVVVVIGDLLSGNFSFKKLYSHFDYHHRTTTTRMKIQFPSSIFSWKDTFDIFLKCSKEAGRFRTDFSDEKLCKILSCFFANICDRWGL